MYCWCSVILTFFFPSSKLVRHSSFQELHSQRQITVPGHKKRRKDKQVTPALLVLCIVQYCQVYISVLPE